MPDKVIILFGLFLIAALTVHIVSWVGSVLHSVPNAGDSGYAVFTFRSDQNNPMSTNILMNILVPNVILIFIYMILYRFNINFDYRDLKFYVLFYYLYRTILISVILKRKELFNVTYELFNIVISLLIAYFLLEHFLVKPDKVFISLEELVNEFWLVVIVIVYKFGILLLDKGFCQRKVVNKKMLDRYIRNTFIRFYEKYKHIIHISKEDRTVWLLLFSIMIFENYNRGGIIRKVERIKIFFGQSATVGIMQIKSSENITDEESIKLAYDKLKNEIMLADLDVDDEMQIKDYAFEYNHDENYSKSVSFIYQSLKEYLSQDQKYKELFCLIEEDRWQESNENVCEEQKICYDMQGDNVAEQSYMTIDDIAESLGIPPKKIRKKIKKKDMTIFLNEGEVVKVFKKYFPKAE